MLSLWRYLGREAVVAPGFAFAATSLRALAEELAARCMDPPWCSIGFPNLGNTCYINAVLQCLFHCAPFRRDLWRQAEGTSYMGDCLRCLLRTYCDPTSTAIDTMAPLVRTVRQVLAHSGFPGGSQLDAAECLMHLLQSIDQGRCHLRVCGVYAARSVEGMILCPAPAEVHARGVVPTAVPIAEFLVAALTADCAVRQAPPALLLLVENTY